MTTETVAIVAFGAFLVGMLLGMIVPIICIRIYNALDLSLGELCAEEEEKGNE